MKHQNTFADDMIKKWEAGSHDEVRRVIRASIHKGQAAYVSAYVATQVSDPAAFVEFMHPANG